MQLGISSFTFGWAVGVRGFEAPSVPLDAFGLLERANDWGISLVQFGDNLPLHELCDDELVALAAQARRCGIQLEAGARGLTPENLERYVRIAQRLDASILRFVIDEKHYEPAPSHIIATLRNAIPDLGGLTIGIENHDRFSARSLREIIDSVGDSRIGICLDTANSLGAGEGLHHVVDVLAPVTVNWHIKDYHIERLPYLMGFSITGRPAGAGMMDLTFVYDQLKAHSSCQSAVLELWTPPEAKMAQTINKELKWAKQSLEYLRDMI